MEDDSSSSKSSDCSRAERSIEGEDDEQSSMQSALHYAVGRICRAVEEEEEEAGLASAAATTPTPKAKMSQDGIAALSELVFHYATKSLANDLVSFSAHANRRTVNSEDVKLVLRKQPDRALALERFRRERAGAAGASSKSSDKRRPRKMPSASVYSRGVGSGGVGGIGHRASVGKKKASVAADQSRQRTAHAESSRPREGRGTAVDDMDLEDQRGYESGSSGSSSPSTRKKTSRKKTFDMDSESDSSIDDEFRFRPTRDRSNGSDIANEALMSVGSDGDCSSGEPDGETSSKSSRRGDSSALVIDLCEE